MADKAQLIVAASETDANLYYATGFWAPDPFIFARVGGKKILIMSDLEIDRAREQSHVDEILSMTKLQREMKKQSNGTGLAGLIVTLFKEREVDQVEVPSSFPLGLADQLRQEGLQLTVAEDPFLPERTVKRPEEVEAIRQAIRKTEDAIASVIELIRGSQIKGEDLWIRERPLTSELVRKTLHLTLMGSDCLARETIVAGGAQGCDPHCIGSGPLKAHWPIVLDVFPMSMESRYYADISRTVVKGKASEKVRRMYLAVQEGQEIAFGKLKAGVDGKEIHEAILDHFKSEGFKTGEENGRMVGFFHGTGHGLGLEIHEPPRISPVSDILKAGQVVTVEPGLYYPDAGGVRIEDDVLVTETGFENLTQAPKILEIDS